MGEFTVKSMLLVVALTAALAPCALGQAPEPPVMPPAPEDDAPTRPQFEQSPLQLWLQPDKNGNLAPVPVFAPDDEGELKQHVLSWTDIVRLLDRVADQQSPRVSCQRVEVTGVVNGNRASLEIELTFLTSPQRWVRATLGLSSAVISKFESPTGGFLDYDEKEGFVFWMPPVAPVASSEAAEGARPAKEALNENDSMPMMPAQQPVERTLSITASAPVTEIGPERRLSVRVPRAPISHIELLVDMPEAQANLVGSDAPVSVKAAGTGQTRIAVEGVGGELAIFWRPKRTTAPAAAPVLKAQGVLEVVLGEDDQLQASARLTVQSLSEPFQSFTVKLPPGMRLTPSESPEYEITPVEPAGNAEAGLRQKAIVRLRQETIGPVTVRLDAASGPQARKTEFVEVGGFEIDEAVEQWGRVLLIASAEESVSWVESANVVQSSEPLASGETDDVAAQFRYFAQPFSLQVKAAPQRTRIRVEPTYVIEVFSDYVKLTANLAYQIQGAKANLVRVNLQGWEFDSVGGDDVVNPLVKSDHLAPLEIPFTTGITGDVTVRLTAQRIVEGDKGSLRIPLPAPEADFVVSALVAVAPNDNIELTPVAEQLHGLIPEPPAPLDGFEIARKATFFYRTRTGETQPVFAADYEVKEGEVSVEAEGEVRIQAERVTVRQEFSYNFAYEPVDRLVVEVPGEAQASGDLQLLFDDSPVPFKIETADAAPGGRVRLRVTPPMALGRHVLAVEYSLPLPEIAAQQTIAYAIPLATPAAADSQSKAPRMLSNTMRLSPSRPLQAAPDGRAWQLRARNGNVVREESVLSAEGPQDQLPLAITHQKSDEQLSNALDRLWLQTWLTASQRRDHAAMQVVSHETRFRVRLPSGADPESLIVILDGHRLPAELLSVETSGTDMSAIVAIDLESVNSSPFELEFWYGFKTARESAWPARLEAPEFLDVSWVRQIYWQLVLPPDELLIGSPAGYTPEHTWRREGLWWRRAPTLGQRELEQWSGASEQPAPPGVAGEHLFSSFGAPQALEVRTLSRPSAVLGWSGLVLVLGLLLLRVSPRRQLRWLAYAGLVGSLAVIAAIVLLPEMAVTALQCAAVGAAGVALAWFFGRIGTSRSPRSPAAGASSVHSRATTSASTRTERRPVSAAPVGLPHDSSR